MRVPLHKNEKGQHLINLTDAIQNKKEFSKCLTCFNLFNYKNFYFVVIFQLDLNIRQSVMAIPHLTHVEVIEEIGLHLHDNN